MQWPEEMASIFHLAHHEAGLRVIHVLLDTRCDRSCDHLGGDDLPTIEVLVLDPGAHCETVEQIFVDEMRAHSINADVGNVKVHGFLQGLVGALVPQLVCRIRKAPDHHSHRERVILGHQ